MPNWGKSAQAFSWIHAFQSLSRDSTRSSPFIGDRSARLVRAVSIPQSGFHAFKRLSAGIPDAGRPDVSIPQSGFHAFKLGDVAVGVDDQGGIVSIPQSGFHAFKLFGSRGLRGALRFLFQSLSRDSTRSSLGRRVLSVSESDVSIPQSGFHAFKLVVGTILIDSGVFKFQSLSRDSTRSSKGLPCSIGFLSFVFQSLSRDSTRSSWYCNEVCGFRDSCVSIPQSGFHAFKRKAGPAGRCVRFQCFNPSVGIPRVQAES